MTTSDQKPPAEYKLYSTFSSSLMTWGIPGVMLAMVPVVLYVSWSKMDESERVFGVPFAILWCAGVLASFIWSIRFPRRIELHEDGRVVFRGPLRRLELRVTEISSIKPGGNQVGFLVVKHSRGRLYLLNQFDGFHELLTSLKQANPSIELRGC